VKKYKDCISMMELLNLIAPLPRTIANSATDKALDIVKRFLPNSIIHGFRTGSKVWTWTIPKRWELNKASIKAGGKTIVHSDWSILHVLNYSVPVQGNFTREEILKHIHTIPSQEHAFPFVFSFYKEQWGFSIPHSWLDRFSADTYDVQIDSKFEDGLLNCLTCFIPGESNQTFVISSNICHPLQVNDSLTGVAVAADIANRLSRREKLKYSYLIMVVPETIGTIAYLANNSNLIEKCIGGFFSEMLGTNTPLVGQKTRKGITYWDSILVNLSKYGASKFKIVDFLKSAANDEKVLDSPGVNIPTISLTRYPYSEYHTNRDNMGIIKEEKLREARNILQQIIDYAEEDYVPIIRNPGPIFLSGYDLYPDWREDPSLKPLWDSFLDVMYSIDGVHSVIELANKKNISIEHFFYWTNKFHEKGLIQKKSFIINKQNEKNQF